MLEQRLLAAGLEASAFRIIKNSLEESEATPQAWELLKILGEFYKKNKDAQGIDKESLQEWVSLTVENPKHALDFIELVKSLPEVGSSMAVAGIVREQKVKATRLKLAAAFQSGGDTHNLLRKFEELQRDPNEGVVLLSDKENFLSTFEEVTSGNRIRLWPKRLQQATGGALKGHHIVIFARPERGKSLFTINMVAGFLYDGLRVLYIGNEDPIVSIKSRIASRLCGATKEQFESDINGYYDKAAERGIGNLRAERLTPGSVTEIEVLVKEHKPDVLVVDQLRNLNTRAGGDGITTRIDVAAQEIRELLGTYDMIGISIAQAGAGQFNENDTKVFLSESDIDSSKTGLPAAADLLIGIGGSEEQIATGQRGISLCKNKLSGDHAKFLVRFDIHRNRVEG